MGPVGWFLLGEVLLLGIRAGTTLAGGADWGFPGDGWRSVWQVAMVTIAVVGLLVPVALRPAALLVGVVYLVVTILELFDGTSLFGVIPVDARDRIIHPAVALLAALALLVTRRVARSSTRSADEIRS